MFSICPAKEGIQAVDGNAPTEQVRRAVFFKVKFTRWIDFVDRIAGRVYVRLQRYSYCRIPDTPRYIIGPTY